MFDSRLSDSIQTFGQVHSITILEEQGAGDILFDSHLAESALIFVCCVFCDVSSKSCPITLGIRRVFERLYSNLWARLSDSIQTFGQGRFYLIHIWPSLLKSLRVAFLRRVKQVMCSHPRDLPGAASDESGADQSEDSEADDSENAEIKCIGCGITSNADNPIVEERKQQKGKVLWGKTTTRRYKKRGKKVK